MGGFLDFISNIVPITGNSFTDSLLFLVIGSIAFALGWAAGGVVKGNSETKSSAHWFVRTFVFLGLLGLVSGIVWLIKLIMSIEWWVWLIILVSLAHLIAGIVLLFKRRKKKINDKNEKS
ncbi:MAG: hypothetical protein J5666_00080 [Bacilli bacterium]|nr:hypothetical protein [Bacilli bacterium]